MVRGVGLATLVLLAGRGLLALFVDVFLASGSERILHPKTCGGWTAFTHYIDYGLFNDADWHLYIARAIEDRSTWIRLAPGQAHGDLEWVNPNLLRVSWGLRDGCLTRVNDIVIEWRP